MRPPSLALHRLCRRRLGRFNPPLLGVPGRCRTVADSVLPTSSGTHAGSVSMQIVLDALLGETLSPRGTTPWTTANHLHATAVRTDPEHVLHRFNQCVQAVLIDAMHRRQPFSAEETREIRRRLPVATDVDGRADESSSGCDLRAVGTTTLQTMLRRLRRAPVTEWRSLGRAYLADGWRRATQMEASEGHRQRAMLQQVWDDLLFPWSQHDALSGLGDPRDLGAALQAITALVQWQVDCILEAATGGTSAPVCSTVWALTSPRWLRKLRKGICSQGRIGNIVAFAEGLCALIQQEQRLPMGSELVHDAELLQFLVTIPCRRDAGLARDDIAQRTTAYALFALPRLWHLSQVQRRDPNEAVFKCIQSASNAVAFAKNDNGEVERLTAFAHKVLTTLAACHSGGTPANAAQDPARRLVLPAVCVQGVCDAVCNAAMQKCVALQYTTAGAWMALACLRATMANWLQHAASLEQSALVPLDDVLLALGTYAPHSESLHVAANRDVARRVLDDAQQLLVAMAAVVRAPDVFDRIGLHVSEIVDVVLKPYAFACSTYQPLVTAVSAVAPQASLWCKRHASQGTWTCGCGALVMGTLSSCPQCSLRDDVQGVSGFPQRYECPLCHCVAHGSSLCGCRSCGAEHPRILSSVAAASWDCSVCSSHVPMTEPACGTCKAVNPLHAVVCATCRFRNRVDQQCCKQCGDSLSSPTSGQPHNVPIMWLCSACDALSEVRADDTLDGTPPPLCLVCAARGQGRAVQSAGSAPLRATHHFQWQCGCGTWNGPSSRRCYACCAQPQQPDAARPGSAAAPPVHYYRCPACQCACGANNVLAVPLSGTHIGWGAKSVLAVCAACQTVHPRDVALLHTRRLATCPSCEGPVPMVRPAAVPASCPHCAAPIDSWSAQATAVTDTPWPCHACGATNHPTRGGDAAAVCLHCATERPSALLFQLNERWSCANCGNASCRGFYCTTCGVPNAHLPLAEVPLWGCTGCHARNYSWDAQCWQCAASPSTRDALFSSAPWQCRRCSAKNGAANEACFQCGVRPHTTTTPRVAVASSTDAGTDLDSVRALLLAAAKERGDTSTDDASLWMDMDRVHGIDSMDALANSDADVSDVMRRLSFPL